MTYLQRLDMDVLDRLLTNIRLSHPPPYTMEQDWTWEVHDSRGRIVCKFMSRQEAERFVELLVSD